MAVITRWSYKRGGRKAGFHCIHFSIFGQFFELSRPSVSCPYANKLIYCEFVAPYIKRVQK